MRSQWAPRARIAASGPHDSPGTPETANPTPEFRTLDHGSRLASTVVGGLIRRSLDLEVLYVGQSYGDGGSRNATQRLQSHSTLQGIYAEAIQHSPDQEVWLVLLCFERYLLASFDGITKSYQTSDEEDDNHRVKVLGNPISEQQEINFTEAALIKYFRPEFNVKYKDTFPSPAHSTYEQCYAMDLNMVAAELQTEELMLRLWSPSVHPQWVHLAKFPLHNEAERRYMFQIE